MDVYKEGKKMKKKENEEIKVILVGEAGTGKTSLIHRYINKVFEDGIFLVGKDKYSKSYYFDDINYQVASREDQDSMMADYRKFINALDSNALTKITIFNRRINKEDFAAKVLIDNKKDEMDKLNKELLVLRKKVDPALMESYDKKRKEKLFPIIFEAKEDVCGACSMNLSMIDIAKLKNGEIIECDNCRRLLYKA